MITLQQRTGAAAGSGGWTQIGGTTVTTSGTTVAITSIPSGYRRLVLRLNGISFTANVALTFALSSNNGGAYGTAFTVSAALSNNTNTIQGMIEIDAVGDTGIPKTLISTTAVVTGTATILGNIDSTTTGVIDAIRLAGGTFDAGSVTLWGIK